MTVKSFPISTIFVPTHLNMMTAPFLWADLEERLLPNVTVVLDMKNTKFVDNNGVHILHQALEKSKAVKAKLQFVGMSKSVEIRLIAGGVMR